MYAPQVHAHTRPRLFNPVPEIKTWKSWVTIPHTQKLKEAKASLKVKWDSNPFRAARHKGGPLFADVPYGTGLDE